MPDRIETTLGKAVTEFQSAIDARASSGHALSHWLPVARDGVSPPFRQKGALTNREASVPDLVQLCGTFDWAYEFAHVQAYTPGELDLPDSSLRAMADRFAAEALTRERVAVFSELRTLSPPVTDPLDPKALGAIVQELGGACRFIGASEHADRALTTGVLEDVKAYPGGNPVGTVGMLVRLDLGPVVRRLGDGLTMGWTRLADGGVRLEVDERFFLERPEEVRWFQTVAPPSTSAPTGLTAWPAIGTSPQGP